MRLTTDRLELIAGTLELAEADISDRAEFSRLLDARVPENWPPPLNDLQSMEWTKNFAEAHPNDTGWCTWYFVRRHDRIAVGNGGFKGAPLPDGTVEIGYSLIPEFQKIGYGTEATKALIVWAFEHPEVNRIIAETYPYLTPSIRVLEKNGFTYIGARSDEGVIRYELLRVEFVRAEYMQP